MGCFTFEVRQGKVEEEEVSAVGLGCDVTQCFGGMEKGTSMSAKQRIAVYAHAHKAVRRVCAQESLTFPFFRSACFEEIRQSVGAWSHLATLFAGCMMQSERNNACSMNMQSDSNNACGMNMYPDSHTPLETVEMNVVSSI